MIDIVDGHTINQNGIVLVVASLYVDAAAILVVRLDAGQHLGVVHGVCITQYLRQQAHAAHVP